jgi:lysine 2,3-aminomutase
VTTDFRVRSHPGTHPSTGSGVDSGARPGAQPYVYRRRELVEPDWRRFPGWRDVTGAEWESVQWQRAHCVKNVRQLRQVMGNLLGEEFYADLERDQRERATMSMLVPPQMINTMDAG